VNVILIMADQLSARWLGCYGNPAASTPHLDDLAQSGVQFDRCVSPYPVCMPARASLITGRSAQHHGLWYNGWELAPGLTTFPQVLQGQGVQTFGVGKFHLECHGRSAYNDVRKWGFDQAQTTEDIRAGQWLDWVEREHPEHFQRALATVWPMPHLNDYGPDHRDLLTEVREAHAAHPPNVQARMTYPSIIDAHVCQTRWVGNEAIQYIENRDPSRPFFLKMSFVDPHDPYDPPAEYLDRIDPALVPEPLESGDPALHRAVQRYQHVHFIRSFNEVTRDDWLTMRRYYLASVAFIDDQVGRVMECLRSQGIADDTLVIFTADHGDMLGDYGLATKGGWHFDACYRIPMIVAGAGVSPHRDPSMVTLLDIFPTVIDYMNAPDEVPVEGLSLRPVLEESGNLDRPDAALIESYGNYGVIDVDLRSRSVLTPQWHYTEFGDGSGMLFDLDNDPLESTNLWDARDLACERTRLKCLMCDLMAHQNEPLPLRQRHPSAQH